MSDKDTVLDICRRIERALQRDWGSTGTGLSQRLRTTRYVVPPELRKRIQYLRGMQKQALHKERFRLKSAADFEAKGEQVLGELAEARKTAVRRLKPWLKDLVLKHRVLFSASVATLLVAVVGGLYLLLEPEPALPPVVVSAPKPAPKPVPKPAPKPVAAPAPVSTAPAPAAAPEPVAAAAAVPTPEPAAPEATAIPLNAKVHIEAPSQVSIVLKRAEVVQGTSGREEIVVIVDVQNIAYPSLKRITFDASLYDTSSGKFVTVIAPGIRDAIPWHAFLRQGIKRGQNAEVRLSYISTSEWSADKVVALVNSGRYQIRLKTLTLTDDNNQTLPL